MTSSQISPWNKWALCSTLIDLVIIKSKNFKQLFERSDQTSHKKSPSKSWKSKRSGERCYWRLNIPKVTAAKGLHSDLHKFIMLWAIKGSSYYYGKENSLPILSLRQHIHENMSMCIKSRQSEPKPASLELCTVIWFSNIGQTERKLMTWTHDLH